MTFLTVFAGPIGILTWKDRAAMDAALGDKDVAGKVFGDVSNFSNKAPMFIAGDVKGSG